MQHIQKIQLESTESKGLAYISSQFNDASFIVVSLSYLPKPMEALSFTATNRVTCCNPSEIESFSSSHPLFNTSLFYVDVENHGKTAWNVYLSLKRGGYTGPILFANIWQHKSMRDDCWYKIPETCKYDMTDYGFGLVQSSATSLATGLATSSATSLAITPKPNLDKWTLVTAYFDLTKCSDASSEIRERDTNHYFLHATSTLSLPYNMVIYCDEASYPHLVKIRPPELSVKTHYVIIEFDSFVLREKSFATYRQQIANNRVVHPYEFDGRNTPSYYLFCMSRYIMLKQVIDENRFHSTHFAWVNLCLERMGIQNIRRLPEALSLHRNKFSTCYIDYIPEEWVKQTDFYFRRGRCSLCSGFFTGDATHMYRVCGLIENKFIEYVEQGYGHADEQLYSPVLFANPELFETFYGDYTEMVTNYAHVYENPHSILTNFIANSYRFGDNRRCFAACLAVWKSFVHQKCVLTQPQAEKLCFYYMMSSQRMVIK
jgi:hypothetical protein